MVPSLDNGLTFIETLSNPFQGGIQEPVGAAQGIADVPRPEHHVLRSRARSRRGCSAGRSASSASCPDRWCSRRRYVGNRGSDIQTTRNINSTPLQYLSTSPTRDQATIDYLSANVPNPFFGLMPVTAGDGLPRARPSPASGCCGRIRSSTPSTPRPTRASPGTTRCRPACRSASRAGYTIGAQLHLLALRGGHRVPERRGSGADQDDLEPGRAAPAVGQRHLRDCRSAAAGASPRT